MTRKRITLAGIACLLLAVALVFWLAQPDDIHQPAPSRLQGTNLEEPTTEVIPAPVDDAESDRQADSQLPPLAEPADAAEPRQIVLRIQSSFGTPSAQFSFTYQLENMQSLHEGEATDRRNGPPPTFRFEGRTDSEGQFAVPPGTLKQVTSLHAIRIAHNHPHVRWEPHQSGLHPQEAVVYIRPEQDVYTLTLYRLSSVTFEIVYEDGAPFVGDIGGSIHQQSGKWYSFRADVGPTGSAELSVPADLERINFPIYGTRKGFKSFSTISRTATQLMPFERIIIPRDPEQAVLRVDLSNWTQGEAVEIRVGKWLGMTGASPSKATGGEVWEDISLLATAEGMPHYAVVSGPSGIWRSKLFQMQLGNTTVLTPTPAMPAKVTARIVNEAGTPVTPAVITTTPWKYVNWYWDAKENATADGGKSSNGEKVNAGPDGRCELGGLMPGKTKLIVEAWRHEVIELELDLPPGETMDLGDIVCKPAQGKVIIRLANHRPDVKYVVWFWTPPPDNPHLVVFQDEPGELFEIDGIPLRPYQIGLAAGNGGETKEFGVVTLSEDNPVFEVVVDVSSLKTREEARKARQSD